MSLRHSNTGCKSPTSKRIILMGRSINERLSNAGLMDELELAWQVKDRNAMVRLLNVVERRNKRSELWKRYCGMFDRPVALITEPLLGKRNASGFPRNEFARRGIVTNGSAIMLT